MRSFKGCWAFLLVFKCPIFLIFPYFSLEEKLMWNLTEVVSYFWSIYELLMNSQRIML